MKRRKLIVALEMMGCILIRHGSNHDWYQNPKTGFFQPIPRHPDINERLATQIIKKLQND